MDLITHLPVSPDTGNDSVVVYVDRLTKMGHFIPTHHTVDAPTLADLYIEHVFRLHGVSRRVVSDRDPRFTAEFWRHVFSRLGTKLHMSSGYHPQTDGQTERMNRTLEEMLRSFCGGAGMEARWEQYLPLVEFQYNNGTQATTGYSPFFLNAGQHPHTPASLTAGASAVTMRVPAADSWLQTMEEALVAARAAIERAQANQARYYDSRRRAVEYEVGDLVYVAVQGLPKTRRGSKVAHRRKGPFRVAKRIGKVAYLLDLPATWSVHPVFHVSFLERHRPDSEGWHAPPELAEVVEARYIGPQGSRTLWFQVRHADAAADDDVWLTADQLQVAAPSLFNEWHHTHSLATVPVAVLARRISQEDDMLDDFQVLYDDGAVLWVPDHVLVWRAPTMMQEFIDVELAERDASAGARA